MIPKRLEDVEPADFQALIDAGRRESKDIEYKRELPGRAQSDKDKFAAGVSSLANTAGGDLVLGIDAKQGLPRAVPGARSDNVDADKLRLEQLLANGVEPRLSRVDVHPVLLESGNHVFVVRVPKSWLSPHRVKQNSKFYGRNSGGRSELDVSQLRTAFTLSEGVSDRIRQFRADRIAKIYGRETPVPLRGGGCMILHCLPLRSFMDTLNFDLRYYRRKPDPRLFPTRSGGFNTRLNLDGVVTFTVRRDETAVAYTQLFRTGAYEAALVLGVDEQENTILPSVDFEERGIDLLKTYIEVAGEIGAEPPVYVFLSFIEMRGCRLGLGGMRPVLENAPSLREDVVVLPEVTIEDFAMPAHTVLRPAFDMVWNAFDFEGSINYDSEGNWVGASQG